MHTNEETVFLKLLKCSIDTGNETLSVFAHSKLQLYTYGNDFTKFLEDKRHYFYHQWEKKYLACCECPAAGCAIQKTHTMDNWIFKKFYSNTGNEDPNHVLKKSGCIVQKCIHIYTAQNIQIVDLDISILCYLLRYNAALSTIEKKAVETLNSIRAELCHVSSTKSFSATALYDMWNDLEKATLDITNPLYRRLVKQQILFHRNIVLNNEEIEHLRIAIDKITAEIQDIKDSNSSNNKVLLNHIDEHGDNIKHQIAKTQEAVSLQLQDFTSEVTDTIKRETFEWKEHKKQSLKEISDQQKAMRQEQAHFIHQINNILLKVACSRPVYTLVPEEELEGAKDCPVLWQFETPEGFDVENIETTLKDNASLKGERFKVKFVRPGSLIMMTTVPAYVLNDSLVFESAVKSFLSKLVEVCKISTDQALELEVTLHVLTTEEVNFSFEIQRTEYQIKKEDKSIEVDFTTDCLLTAREVNFSFETEYQIKKEDKAVQVDFTTDCIKCLDFSKQNDQILNEKQILEDENMLLKTELKNLIEVRRTALDSATEKRSSVTEIKKHYVEGEALGTNTKNYEFDNGSRGYITEHLHLNVLKYICSLLNSSQQGALFIGVEKNGSVVGIECNHETEDKIRLKINQAINTIKPPIFPDNLNVEFVPVFHKDGSVKEGYKVIKITIENVDFDSPQQIYQIDGNVYVRQDGIIQGPLKPSEIQEWSKQLHTAITKHRNHVHQQDTLQRLQGTNDALDTEKKDVEEKDQDEQTNNLQKNVKRRQTSRFCVVM